MNANFSRIRLFIPRKRISPEAEKAEMQKQIARLQTEIGRAGQSKQTPRKITPRNQRTVPPQKFEEPPVAVNPPIYDVFSGDAVGCRQNFKSQAT